MSLIRKTQCQFCKRMISTNGLARVSHLRAHSRRKGLRVVTQTGLSIAEIERQLAADLGDAWNADKTPSADDLEAAFGTLRIPKALSMWQPWASLVAASAKLNETRSQRTHYRGTLAIHATGSTPAWARSFTRTPEVQHALAGRELEAGAILAVVDVVGCQMIGDGTTRLLSAQEVLFGNYTPGRFMWQFKNIRELREPVYVKGWQGLWNVPADVQAKIREQLKRAA